MDGRVKVRVTGPAKIGSAWLKPGDEVEVTVAERAELALAGVIAVDEMQAVDTGEAAVGTTVTDLVQARDAALARATEAEGRVFALSARIADLEAQAGARVAAATGVPKTGKRGAQKDGGQDAP